MYNFLTNSKFIDRNITARWYSRVFIKASKTLKPKINNNRKYTCQEFENYPSESIVFIKIKINYDLNTLIVKCLVN